jgi:glutamate-1-semialdehyde 2,1-aminomutase
MIGKLATEALSAAGVVHRVQYAGNLFSIFFSASPVIDFAGAQAAETWRYPAFFHSMLDHGVYLPPSAFESWFVTAAHDDAAIDRIASALPAAARAAAEAVPVSK